MFDADFFFCFLLIYQAVGLACPLCRLALYHCAQRFPAAGWFLSRHVCVLGVNACVADFLPVLFFFGFSLDLPSSLFGLPAVPTRTLPLRSAFPCRGLVSGPACLCVGGARNMRICFLSFYFVCVCV